jgi:flagellar hook-basal body complex protein FliE
MANIDQTKLLSMRNSILQQNGALQRAVGAPGLDGAAGAATEKSQFGGALDSALSAVNGQQTRAQAATSMYERGETNDIVGVMMERHKASLAFETTLQVRNKLLTAYKDIMNMPV